ncbi:MAG: class I SAM-dependent methyltransferase [Spirochaetaceae bacterium]
MARTKPFDENSEQYENWFVEFKPVYESELAALRPLIPPEARAVEIGVGSGLFAKPLGIEEGVEPSRAMAERARRRGITVHEGVAESLPLESNTYDVALMVTTICFVDDLDASVDEMARILKSDGRIVFGFVDRDTPLGHVYQQYKDQDPFYRHATFYSASEAIEILRNHGFTPARAVQTVFGMLDQIREPQKPREGYGEGGFVALEAVRSGEKR